MILSQAYVEGALIVAERLRSRVAQIKIPGCGNLSTSIGIAAFPSPATSRATQLLAADAALYSAKRAGPNRICVVEHSRGNLDQSSAPIPSTHDEVTDMADPSM